MRDDLTRDWFGDGEDPAKYDPARSARAGMKPNLPKRFYTAVTVEPREGLYAILLDGKPARTRLKRLIAAETEAAAKLVAAEWEAQVGVINPASMPATRILHAAIDHVSEAREEVVADILKYAGSDLVCYRAGEPDRLVALQAQHWDGVLAHIQSAYGARFLLSEGIRFVEQAESSIAALRAPIECHKAAAALAALHVLTTISGSALIALAVADRAITPEEGFDAGEVDADYEASVWGLDEEAAARRATKRDDFLAAVALLFALES